MLHPVRLRTLPRRTVKILCGVIYGKNGDSRLNLYTSDNESPTGLRKCMELDPTTENQQALRRRGIPVSLTPGAWGELQLRMTTDIELFEFAEQHDGPDSGGPPAE